MRNEPSTKTTLATRPSIFDLSFDELSDVLHQYRQPAFRTKQIWRALYAERIGSFEGMTTLPKGLRNRLSEFYAFDPIEQVLSRRSRDGQVSKKLFRLADGELIETVLMRYDAREESRGRRTVCISTQAGCALGCTFCATGQQGFRRNLTSGEIASQVIYLDRQMGPKDGVTNVVFMGMGEPFANYENTMAAVEKLNDPNGFKLGARHMTISTVGLVPQILKLAEEPFQVNLAISLHAPTNAQRAKTMPINKRYPIEQLIRACRTYISKTNRRVSFEYVLMSGQNDHPSDAEVLAELLRDMLCHVNLIPVNPTEAHYQRPDDGRIGKFRDILRAASIPVTVRFEKGTDIDAGCGQLRAASLIDSE